MATETWNVIDGPLEGQQFALDLNYCEEYSFTLSNGTTAIYGADHTNILRYIGVDPFG